MTETLHVPFDIFGMREEVTVSSLVRNRGLGWTCGQCPLDADGRVVAPGNLCAQAAFVCEMIEGLIPRGNFEPGMIGKLNVYFAETRDGEGARALALIQARFPAAIVVPIRVPYFYYEGLLLEVDVFAATGTRRRAGLTGIEIVEADAVTWALIDLPWAPGISAADLTSQIEAMLATQGLAADTLINDQWQIVGAADDTAKALHDCPLIARPEACVISPGRGPRRLIAALSFSGQRVSKTEHAAPEGPGWLTVRDDGAVLTLHGVAPDPSADLVEQTKRIMAAIGTALDAAGIDFGDLLKVTALYVGGATPEALHDNMKIRHACYHSPGPASTGLPVSGLLAPACAMSINVVAAR